MPDEVNGSAARTGGGACAAAGLMNRAGAAAGQSFWRASCLLCG